MPTSCPACGRPRGTNAECLSCRDAAASELAREARDITPESLPGRTRSLARFVSRPPWWTRAAPGALLAKTRLLWMVLRDFVTGAYGRLSWKAVLAVAAAAAYVVSPFDLVPDFLGPIGWTDDLVVLAMTWGLVKQELREYCAWKGLSPAHFGL